jgi:hypothetical protein
MAAALDWTGGRRASKAARRLVGLGTLASVPAAASGASDWSETYAAEQRVGLVHAVWNVGATVVQTCSWLMHRRGHRFTGMALSAVGLGLTLGAGYLGGHLSFVRGVGVNHTAFDGTVVDWTDVAGAAELTTDKPVRVTAGGEAVMLVRHGDGVHALSATCVHAGGRYMGARSSTGVCGALGIPAGSVWRTEGWSVAQRHWTSRLGTCERTADASTCDRPSHGPGIALDGEGFCPAAASALPGPFWVSPGEAIG